MELMDWSILDVCVLYVSRFIIIYLNIDIKLKAKTNAPSILK
jgi:hypothetical protein